MELGATLLMMEMADESARVARSGGVGQITFYIASIFMAGWLTGKRQELRQKFKDTQGGTMCMDFCCYWWCGCCTIIQDARQIDGATGAKAVCCFKLDYNPSSP